MRFLATPLIKAALASSALALLVGCSTPGEAHDRALPKHHPSAAGGRSTSPSAAAQWAHLLKVFGTEKLYVMAGGDPLHAGLGVIDSDGLRPAGTDMQLFLLSNIAHSQAGVLLGGVQHEGQSYSDGVYMLRGDRMKQILPPGAGYFGPTERRDGALSAIQPQNGLFVRNSATGKWLQVPGSEGLTLSSAAWGPGDTAYAVRDPGTKRAHVLMFQARGATRDLGSFPGARLVFTSPRGDMVATSSAPRAAADRILDSHGGPMKVLPEDWRPLGWSDSEPPRLLLTRGKRIGIWDVRTGRFLIQAGTSTRIWMAVEKPT